MSTAQVRGITGLLDGILSPATTLATDSPEENYTKQNSSAERRPAASDMPTRTTVRRGRPPGKARITQPKEKVTVWIESSLIDSYRDWTWQARCQLSHIVERALAAYHEQHRDGHSPHRYRSHGHTDLP